MSEVAKFQTENYSTDRDALLAAIRAHVTKRGIAAREIYRRLSSLRDDDWKRLMNKEGLYDHTFSLKRGYQIAGAVGLRMRVSIEPDPGAPRLGSPSAASPARPAPLAPRLGMAA